MSTKVKAHMATCALVNFNEGHVNFCFYSVKLNKDMQWSYQQLSRVQSCLAKVDFSYIKYTCFGNNQKVINCSLLWCYSNCNLVLTNVTLCKHIIRAQFCFGLCIHIYHQTVYVRFTFIGFCIIYVQVLLWYIWTHMHN